MFYHRMPCETLACWLLGRMLPCKTHAFWNFIIPCDAADPFWNFGAGYHIKCSLYEAWPWIPCKAHPFWNLGLGYHVNRHPGTCNLKLPAALGLRSGIIVLPEVTFSNLSTDSHATQDKARPQDIHTTKNEERHCPSRKSCYPNWIWNSKPVLGITRM